MKNWGTWLATGLPTLGWDSLPFKMKFVYGVYLLHALIWKKLWPLVAYSLMSYMSSSTNVVARRALSWSPCWVVAARRPPPCFPPDQRPPSIIIITAIHINHQNLLHDDMIVKWISVTPLFRYQKHSASSSSPSHWPEAISPRNLSSLGTNTHVYLNQAGTGRDFWLRVGFG